MWEGGNNACNRVTGKITLNSIRKNLSVAYQIPGTSYRVSYAGEDRDRHLAPIYSNRRTFFYPFVGLESVSIKWNSRNSFGESNFIVCHKDRENSPPTPPPR